MRRWQVKWEVGINHFSIVMYNAQDVGEALDKWRKGHPTREVSAVVSIKEKGIGYP